MEFDKRPDPDALVRRIGDDAARQGGRLKIFFGYAAGVGKTYAMLKAAHEAAQSGIDVVIGYIEPHTRPATIALTAGLETLPVRKSSYRGVELNEFDIDAALERAPQLILVDELAHTNVTGSRHAKRYQDIKELLRQGIDVYTTVNVQHIESLNDIVATITGITVKERVPDKVFDEAYQVELVDIEPEELLERLKSGKIYAKAQAGRAMDNFFTASNLTALREIALRRTADRVNHVASKSASIGRGAPNVSEHILICLSAAPSNPRVIRTAARMCEAFHGQFTALYVAPEQDAAEHGAHDAVPEENMRLAERMGARIVTVYGDDIPYQIAAYAQLSGVTKIVLGRSNARTHIWPMRRSLGDRLLELMPDTDIYVIPDSSHASGGRRMSERTPLSLRSVLCTALIFTLSTALSVACSYMGLNEACVVTIYAFGIMLSAMATGNRLLGLIMSLGCVLAYNFLFTAPYYTLAIDDASHIITFAVMFLVSLTACSMSHKMHRHARQEAAKAHRTEILLRASRQLLSASSETDILHSAAKQLSELLGRSIAMYPADGALKSPIFIQAKGDTNGYDFYINNEEYAAANWALQNRKHAGATTGTLPGAKSLYLTARNRDSVQAVVGISMANGQPLDSFEQNLLLALMDMLALAIERIRLSESKGQAALKENQDILRANIAHMLAQDMCTPLGSISENVNALMNNSLLSSDERANVLACIDNSVRMLCGTFKDLSVISQSTDSAPPYAPVKRMLYKAAESVKRDMGGRMHIQPCDSALMARMDERLAVHVIAGLLLNSMRYAPCDSQIELSARTDGDRAVISISDTGMNIADDERKHMFDPFHAERMPLSGNHRSAGFMLMLYAGELSSRGGKIESLCDAQGRNVFVISMPRA